MPCLDCGAPGHRRRCPSCTRGLDRSRGTTAARGYGGQHQSEREQWRPHVERGEVDCWRCRERIHEAEPWDLGHDDGDRSRYRGPEHVRCNRATTGR